MFPKTRSLLNEIITEKAAPGITYQIITKKQHETKLIGAKQLVPSKQPLTADQKNYYDIASLTKVIATTIRICQLIESKKLTTESLVQSFLPEFRYPDITVLDLLTHSSGLAKSIPGFKIENRTDLRRYVFSTEQVRARHEFVEYSDVNFLLLGYLIETLDGAFEKSIKKHILGPLCMNDTTFYQAMNKDQSIPTEIDPNRGLIQGVVHDFKAFIAKENTGHAGLFSTMTDLSLFAQALLLNDGTPILSKEMTKRLAQNYTPSLNRSRGLGFDLKKTNHGYALYHTGFTGTFITLDLETKNGLIVLSNRVHPTRKNNLFNEKRDIIAETFLKETESYSKK
ncbi:serine hydrolase [Listeria sp. PSOL-1]|uniref:serine hydrolase domain-containing protein n=1 Tax=Listeria sp. PSOL-1 TaxID=1844999 RepID=UPI0013D42D84|nr:serine hydrolase domain-containing protein [Listeria sp. PSOL-1]